MERKLLINKGDSKTELIEAVKQMLNEHLQVLVTIQPVYDKRSLKQNALYQVYIKRMAEQSGLSSQPNGEKYLRCMVKQKAVELGYPPMIKEDGSLAYEDVEYMGDKYSFIMGKSSKDASIAEFKYLLTACDLLAQEFDFVLDNTQY